MLRISKWIPRQLMRMALQAARWSMYRPFHASLRQAAKFEQDWLLRRVRNCQHTDFGRDYGFSSINTVDDYRRQVPVGDYSRMATYINSVAAGRSEALLPHDDSLVQFTITTGSTGTPKLNPVTRTWLREYLNGWNTWGVKLFTDHPRQIGSRVLQMAGTWNMGRTVGGHQISMVSALLTRNQSPLIKPFYAIPEPLNNVPDPAVRHYVALRLCIRDDIGWIMLMNPGTLVRLAEIGDAQKESLIRDVRNGTLALDLEIPDSIRESLKRFIPAPDHDGAHALEQIVERTGRLLPRDYWNQPVISCWLGGTAGFQSRYLHDYFGGSPMRDMGLVSSEGRHTIPLADNVAYGVPSVGAGFYEFIPVEETKDPACNVLEGHQLLVDRDYRLVITNSAGYYRFDIGDVVRCRGFVGEAPLLEFIQKNDRVGDLEGEKLTEHQIIEAAHRTAAKLGINLGLFTGIPRRLERQMPRYDFLVSVADLPESRQSEQFLQLLDQELGQLNFLWRARRKEGVLAAPRLCRLRANAWDQYIQSELRRRGTGDYQYKHPGLVQDQEWMKNFSPLDVILLK